MSGFVVQDDPVWGTLTVRENLNFSAALRLGSRYTSDERKSRVDGIIDDLGLIACADTKVGTDEFRGVSGGMLSRASVQLSCEHNAKFLSPINLK